MARPNKIIPSRVFTFRLPQPLADTADKHLKISELCQRTVVDALSEVLKPDEAEPLKEEFEAWSKDRFYRWKK